MTMISFHLLRLLHFILIALSAKAAKSTMRKDSECYTANGRDYEGTQATTYVIGDEVYEPTRPNIEDCLPWKDIEFDFNVTDRDTALPKNYCRNPNNMLFPYCFVNRDGEKVRSYCHIPTCSTPALLGCFKLYVSGSPPSEDENVTTTGPSPDLILDGEDSIDNDEDMKIGECLKFCRSKEYDYAGVTGGDTCMCGKEKVDGPSIRDVANHLHPHECIQNACVGDRLQGCGGDYAIAIYDVEAGSCQPEPHFDRDMGVIYSPRWPGTYQNDAKCQWTVYIPDRFLKNAVKRKNYKVHVYFPYFNLEKKNDSLKIYKYYNDSMSGSELVAKYTGEEKEMPAEIILEVSEIIAFHIVFASDKDHEHDGFILRYNITNLLGEMETTLPDEVVAESTKGTTFKGPTDAKRKSANPSTIKLSNETGNLGPQPIASSSLNGGQIAGITLGVLLFVILAILAALVIVRRRGELLKEDVTPSNPPAMFDNPVKFSSDDTTL